MPECVSETILHHHEPDKAKDNRCLTHLVYVADLMSSLFVFGHHLDKMDISHLRSSLEVIDFKTGSLQKLLASASSKAFAFTGSL